MAEGGGFTMRIKELFRPNRPTEPVAATIEEAIKLTSNGTPLVRMKPLNVPSSQNTPSESIPVTTDRPNKLPSESVTINTETIATATKETTVPEIVGFLRGQIPNPNLKKGPGKS